VHVVSPYEATYVAERHHKDWNNLKLILLLAYTAEIAVSCAIRVLAAAVAIAFVLCQKRISFIPPCHSRQEKLLLICHSRAASKQATQTFSNMASEQGKTSKENENFTIFR